MISLIVAKASNDVIGGDNKLLWHIADDLKRFKEITTGNTIIMGRKTFESLPKILPNRKHVILTRDKNFSVDSDMVSVYNDFNEILSKYKDSDDEVFVIGGGEIYELFLPYCKKLYITRVHKNFYGDTKFPNIDFSDWSIDYVSEVKVSGFNLKYDFINLIKK